MNQTSFSTVIFNELSGTTKTQRDNWIRAFWQHLDENVDTGEIVHRWQNAGCDPRNIAISIHRYVMTYSLMLSADRKERKKKTKDILTSAVSSLRDLETLYRFYGQVHAANRIANELGLTQDMLSRIDSGFDTKRFGVSRSWSDLAMIEGFVFEVTQQSPTARELVLLIKAGREAAGQEADPWEMNSVNIRKGLKNFKKNNPLQSSLWTTPSRRP
jgi:hypothetical protein